MCRIVEDDGDEVHLSNVAPPTDDVDEEEDRSQPECTGSSQEVATDEDESVDSEVHSNVGAVLFSHHVSYSVECS